MKVSEQFKSTIKAYFDNMAAVDSLFAPVYQKPTKNIPVGGIKIAHI